MRAGRIAAGEAELLAWIAEFDRREGWAGPGMLSCAHWLSWRIGLTPGAAPERVRVAGRLDELPAIAAAFAAGRMSFSNVRTVTRVATGDDGIDWPELARHSSAAQLERLVRGIRRAQCAEQTDTDPEQAAYAVRTRTRYDADGNMTITIYASAEDGAVILAGLEAQRAELDRQRDAVAAEQPPADVSAESPPASTTPTTPAKATDGDALLALARGALDRQAQQQPSAARRTRGRLVAQVDPLSGWGRLRDGELLPPNSLRAVLKTLPGRGALRLRPLTPADLARHDLGRTARDASPALRDLLGRIDGERCRFPGCTRHTNLHAHHVVYWSRGGRTDLANLVLVCARHHTLVHAQGFQLQLRPDRRLEVRSADGVPVLHHPAQPWGHPGELDRDRRITAETLPPTHCDARLDLGYAVSVLLQQAA